jgi:hypothetical protein
VVPEATTVKVLGVVLIFCNEQISTLFRLVSEILLEIKANPSTKHVQEGGVEVRKLPITYTLEPRER